MNRRGNRALCWSFIVVVSLALPSAAQDGILAAEEAGIDIGTPAGDAPPLGTHDFDHRGGALPDFLLIPESTNKRVMAFDPATGNLIDADFIPADDVNLSTPVCAILSSTDDSILVADQIEDVVQEYDLEGNYIGVFAPAGGVNTAILDNIRGISLRDNGNLLVTVGSGANADAVAEFDTDGNYLGNFVANGAGGLDSPFDVTLIGNWMVGGITSDAIHMYDATGAYLSDLTAIDSFPEQVAEAGNGNILVGNFSGSQQGVVEFQTYGTLVGVYAPASLGGYRGAYELPNGNILTTTGDGVHEIDRSGNLVETKVSGVSARFIELISGAVPVELLAIAVE